MFAPTVAPSRHQRLIRPSAALAVLLALASPAHAASLDGATLSVLWAVPFIGILLSIAIWPLAGPNVWHHHFGKIAAGWSLAFLIPFALVFGAGTAAAGLVHAAVGNTSRSSCCSRRCSPCRAASTSAATCTARHC